MISSVDQIISFSKRHPAETIREILRYDSGYLKDLFLKDEKIVFNLDCLAEIKLLTKGHVDNWEKPNGQSSNIFSQLKPYATPYLFDFNNPIIETINNERLLNYKNGVC